MICGLPAWNTPIIFLFPLSPIYIPLIEIRFFETGFYV